jgi:hypothetical protein
MRDKMGTFEDLSRREEVTMGSDRAFGLVFAAVCALLAGLALWHGRRSGILWLAGGAGILVTALVLPALLHPFNRLWFAFGQSLHRLMGPVVLGVIFFGVVTPMALGLRLCNRRPLALEREPATPSYWVPREGPGAAASMKNQF